MALQIPDGSRAEFCRRLARILRRIAYRLDPSEKPGIIDEEKSREIMAALGSVIVEGKLYLDPSVSIDTLAQMIGTNRTYLARTLRLNGITLSDYINGYRIRHAASLIAGNASMDVSEVAELSGFTNQRSFNYFVMKKYGITQVQLRQRIGQLLSELQEGQTRRPYHTDV